MECGKGALRMRGSVPAGNIPKIIVVAEAIGLLLIVVFLWADEIFDLPHHLFGAAATPINSVESAFESLLVLAIGVPILFFTGRLSQRLLQTSSEKDLFFGIISHDLKNPLSALLLSAEALSQNYQEMTEADRQALAAVTHEAAQRTGDLLENLLQWTRLHLSHSALVPENCDLVELARNTLELLGPTAAAKEIVLLSQMPAAAPIFADPEAVRSVLSNLLSNAIKFSPPGKPVELALFDKKDEVAITVTDQGGGMTPAACRDLLRKGRLPTTSGTSGEKGTGLGLMLVRLIVERLNGHLWVKSSPGGGATFGVNLPKVRC